MFNDTSCLLTPPRAFPILGLLILGLVLVGCGSSDSGPDPSDLEGTYVFERFEFTVRGVDNFDVLNDTLVTTERSPRLEFFGGNARVNLVYRMEGSSGSSVIDGQFTTRRNNEVTIDFSQASPEDREQLLLPEVIRFDILDGRVRLSASQRREGVDLASYSPGALRRTHAAGKWYARTAPRPYFRNASSSVVRRIDRFVVRERSYHPDASFRSLICLPPSYDASIDTTLRFFVLPFSAPLIRYRRSVDSDGRQHWHINSTNYRAQHWLYAFTHC